MKKSLLFFCLFSFFVQGIFSQEMNWRNLILDSETNFYQVQESFQNEWRNIERPYPKGKGFMAYKRWEWYMEPRVFPTGKRIPTNAIQLAKQENPAMFPPPSGTSGLWTYIGNSSVPGGGGGAGRVNAIRPQPGSSTIFYACAPAGGLWKTTDAGASWNVLNTDYLDAIGATDVAIDPSNSNIIYLATGDGDAGDTYSIGILKSIDGGTTWAATGLNWNVTQGRMINRLLIHPTNSNILLAATSLGVYKSINAGTSWVLAASGSFKDMEFKPSDPTTVYLAGTTFFKSVDTGDTFTSVTTGVPSTNVGRLAIAVSAANAATVYLLAAKNSDSGFLGVYKSTNSGAAFTTMASTPNLLGWNANGGDAGGQGWYDLALECSGTDANTLWVGGVNVWKSTNGGTSWACNAHWTGSGGLPYVHADVHCLSWIPANNSLFVGCDGGVFRTTNNGTSYSDISSNLQISQQYRLGVAQLNANKILTGWQDNGSNLKNGTTHSQVLGGDGMECIIARTNDNIMYGEIYYGAIYKSTNNGGTFNPIVNSGGTGVDADGAWVTPYAMGATDNDLYVGKSTIYKSSNAGTSFTAMGTFGTGVVNAFAVSASNANVIYASKGSALYKTTNANTFSAISGLPNLYITSISVSSIDENKVWVTLSGYTAGSKVYYSSNGGTSWTNISGSLPNIPSNTIVFHNTGSDALYVGTDAGVYYKDNSLADWIPYMNGLPNVVVDELEIHAATNTITAATYGRGTWRAPLYSQPNLDLAVVSITSPNGNFCSTTVAPELTVMNAGINTITSFQLTYTISGQASQTYSWSGNLTSGNSVLVTLPVSTVSAGSYTLTINASSINGGSDDNAANNSSSSTFTIVSGAANDICSNATNLVINATYVTANNTVTCSDSADPNCGGSSIKDVWYEFTYTGGDITIQTNSGSLVDTRIAIYSDCTDPFAIACNDDISTTNYNSRINLTCAQLTNGATYYIQAGGYAGGTGTFGIQVLATTVNGCTNVLACNYNECANTDNGTCTFASTWYLDADADGYYVSSTSACTSPGATYTSTQGINGDCNDASASVNAAGVEVCGNGIDEDCSGADLACAVPGCTDNTACNYNASATVSNGSCTFASTWYLDADADGYYVSSTSACTSPGATYTSTQGINGDCNDASASVNAAGVEVCGNGIDEDCSGGDLACAVPGCMDNTACNYNASATVSNGSCTFASTWYLDADADGYYVSSTSACTSPGATYTSTQGMNGDCNDASASVNAAGVEVCGNGIDEDCSGADLACAVPGCTDNTACNYNASATVSNGSCTFASTWYLDADADGYYVSSTSACTSPGATYTSTQGINGDCNDASASVNAAGVEVCGNGIDEDCSGGDLACAVPGCMDNTACNYNASATVSNGSCTFASTWYLDADADGYYVSSTSACTSPGATHTSIQGINGDCNDASASVNAAGVEVCGNGIDEDCSGGDLACAVPGCMDNTACNYNASATVSNGSCTFASTWYLDADADGYYVSSTSACTSPGATHTSIQGINGDCNDASASVNAAGVEVCGNGIDEDCSGGDLACAVPGCMNNTACNYNASATVSNGSCTFASTWYLDADADGYYVSSTSACTSPGATYTSTQGMNGDCNDASASVNAAGVEVCGNGIDEDCSGGDLACAVPGCMDNTACNYNASATVSNGSCTFASTWYLDADADGYYVSSTSACTSPGATYTSTQGINGDCNDASASVNAGIGESCSNNIDDNCNGLINEGCNETDVAGDIFTTPINITASFYPLCNLASGNLTGMGASPFGQINCITGEDLWYQFTAQTEGVSIQLNTTAFDGVIEIQNTNGELIASENSNAIIGNEVLNFVGLTSGSVYRVGIRNYNSNLGTGNFTCCVRQLKRGACAYGPGPYQLCQIFKAQYVSGATYRFVFSGISGIANGINYTKASTSDLLVLNSVVPTIPYGSSYNVLITNIYSLSNGIGQIEIIEVPALSSCPMNTIAEPNTQLGASFRCTSGQQFRGAIVNSQPWICGVTNWKWKFQEVDANNMAIGLPFEHLRGAASNVLNLNQVIQLQYGKKYAVQTAPVFSYGTGNYGTTQYMCIVGSAGVQSFENEYKSLEESIQQTVYPNPYDNGPLTIEGNKFDKDSKVDVFIFNAQQQLIRTEQAAIEARKVTLNGLEELENGIYFLIIQSSNSKEIVKLLVIH